MYSTAYSDGDDSAFDYDDERAEILEYELITLAGLRRNGQGNGNGNGHKKGNGNGNGHGNGNGSGHEFKVFNEDGTLRCPTCSLGKKKQVYAYFDLLQHAKAVAVGKRGPKAAGQHSALVQYLEFDLKHLAPVPIAEPVPVPYAVPSRREAEDLLVRPWSVIVRNIFDFKQPSSEEGGRISYGRNEIKTHFAKFNPQKVTVLYDAKGLLGVGVLQFGSDLSGLNDALALEKYFMSHNHGRKDYISHALSNQDYGEAFYGWMAREVDVKGESPGGNGLEIANHLKTYADLKDIGTFGNENARLRELQVLQLGHELAQKTDECLDLKTEIAMMQKRQEAGNQKWEMPPYLGLRCNIV